MSTATLTAGTTTDRPTSTWTCPNCRTETRAPRKRCRDCGTNRY